MENRTAWSLTSAYHLYCDNKVFPLIEALVDKMILEMTPFATFVRYFYQKRFFFVRIEQLVRPNLFNMNLLFGRRTRDYHAHNVRTVDPYMSHFELKKEPSVQIAMFV